MSITYRGSAYEQFWEMCFFTTVARTLHGNSRWLRQSAASTPGRTATDTGSYLFDHRKYRCTGWYEGWRAGDPNHDPDPLRHSV